MSTYIQIGDICTTLKVTVNPQTQPKQIFTHYSIPAFDTGEASVEMGKEILSNKLKIDKPCILFSRLNPRIRRVWDLTSMSYEHPSIASTEFVPFVVKDKKKLFPRYLYWYLHSDQFLAVARAGVKAATKSRERVNKDRLFEVDIPLPPLEEQKRIAAILDKADAIRRKRQDSIRLTEEFLKSVFLDMFGDPVTNPKGWPTGALSDVVSHTKHSLKRGPFGGSLKKEIFVSNGYKVYEQKHAIQNNFSIGSYYINEQKFLDMRSFEIKPGNLIISCSGTVGRIAIVPENIKPGIINQALLKISPDHEKISSLFLKYLLETESVQRELFGFSRGSGIKNFPPMSEVKKLRILLPDRDVITRFHHFDRIHSIFLNKYSLSLGLINNFFNSLVQRVFTGKLG